MVTPGNHLELGTGFRMNLNEGATRDEGNPMNLTQRRFSGDQARGLRFARQVRAGMTHVNDMPVNDEAHLLFGGEKNSGLGRFNGKWAIEEYSTVQWVSVQRQPRDYPF